MTRTQTQWMKISMQNHTVSIKAHSHLLLQRSCVHTPWSHCSPTPAAAPLYLIRLPNQWHHVHDRWPPRYILVEADDLTTLRWGQQLAEVFLGPKPFPAPVVWWVCYETHHSHPAPNRFALDWKWGNPQWFSAQKTEYMCIVSVAY